MTLSHPLLSVTNRSLAVYIHNKSYSLVLVFPAYSCPQQTVFPVLVALSNPIFTHRSPGSWCLDCGFSVRIWWRVLKYWVFGILVFRGMFVESLEIMLFSGFFKFFNSEKKERKCTPTVPRLYVYIYIYIPMRKLNKYQVYTNSMEHECGSTSTPFVCKCVFPSALRQCTSREVFREKSSRGLKPRKLAKSLTVSRGQPEQKNNSVSASSCWGQLRVAFWAPASARPSRCVPHAFIPCSSQRISAAIRDTNQGYFLRKCTEVVG